MNKIIEEIEKKILKEFNPDKLELINNSELHRKHKSFDESKLHLKLIIYSKNLRDMSRMDAHKKIFSLIKDEMKSKIHALEIEIR